MAKNEPQFFFFSRTNDQIIEKDAHGRICKAIQFEFKPTIPQKREQRKAIPRLSALKVSTYSPTSFPRPSSRARSALSAHLSLSHRIRIPYTIYSGYMPPALLLHHPSEIALAIYSRHTPSKVASLLPIGRDAQAEKTAIPIYVPIHRDGGPKEEKRIICALSCT